MKKSKPVYTDWDHTPLNWHTFSVYVQLPISILLSIVHLPASFHTLVELIDTDLSFYANVESLHAIAMLSLAIAAFIYNLPKYRRWAGPCCMIASHVVSFLYSSSCLIASYQYEALFNDRIGYAVQMVGRVILILLLRIYYKKRRLLFSPAPAMPEKEDILPDQSPSPSPIPQNSSDVPPDCSASLPVPSASESDPASLCNRSPVTLHFPIPRKLNATRLFCILSAAFAILSVIFFIMWRSAESELQASSEIISVLNSVIADKNSEIDKLIQGESGNASDFVRQKAAEQRAQREQNSSQSANSENRLEELRKKYLPEKYGTLE